ncbi:MAG: aminotransferase class I/II-fold pyridoxal phosphate-dependent enzyme [Acidobacteriota bacterium]
MSSETSKARPVTADIFQKCYDFQDADAVKRAGLYLYFRTISSAQDPMVLMDGHEVVMLGSNNYLGLTNHPEVKAAAQAAIARYGTGCAGSRFLNGTLDIHVELEEKLAVFMNKPAAVTFSTGFQVNLGTISCLLERGDIVYLDKLDHACIIDGARLGFGSAVKFDHNDAADLQRRLELRDPARGAMIVVDGIFSMEGDVVNLPELVALAKQYGCRIMVDDAHGIGVLGASGRGTAEHFGVENDVDLIMGTFSKSLASVGGFVAGEERIINWIKHRARSLIFSAAPPPASVAAVLKAVEIIEREPERRERLWENTHFMADGLRSLGFDTGDSTTPIIPVVIGEDRLAFLMAKRLQEEGVFVNPVVSPAVPPGRALLRTSYMATHTRAHLERALEGFAKVGRELGVIT